MWVKVSLAAWVAALIVGLLSMAHFSYTPGEAAAAPQTWPSMTKLLPEKHVPTLMVFIHPECACSLATLSELERMLPSILSKTRVYVVFNILNGSGKWREGESFKKVQSLKGVELVIDQSGQEAALFGAKTSGQSLLYDETGHLVFSGGLTPSRGHAGDSLGKFAIQDWINSRSDVLASSDVFGCSMKDKP